ncbi:MAG: helicase-exonuclease AddAB subunit AddB [Lachnospiraceae bacterium]|nr:helicase-exonuclease AddAB subunit AddB [Lachnospiraceae bacterium]
MALQFILGSSGSGKSSYIYEHILAWAKREPDQLFFVVVPEQYTMQAQRELVKRQKRHGIMNLDVVSFQRLAYRVFDELGLAGLPVLEETGKNFVLQKVALTQQEELQILKGHVKKPGYINEIKSMISELMQYRISPGQLEELSRKEQMTAPFRCRMHDLWKMYEGFLDYLRGNYITAEEILEVLAQEAARSGILKGSVLVLDGFTGFTPIQYELLKELLRHCSDMFVTLTLDGREDFYRCQGMQELFYLSKKTIRSLSNIAKEQNVPIEEPVVLTPGKCTRFGQSKSLEWLEQNLFRNGKGAYQGEDCDVRLLCLSNPRQELLFLAGEIQRLVREEGCRYKEIALVCGDVEAYGNYVAEIFGQYEIPYFLDKKNNISFHPLTELIKTALKAVETDFSYEAVMAYLRCGLSGNARDEVDLLENYLLANRIRGWRMWQEKWVRLSGVSGMEELEEVNRLRVQITEQFAHPLSVWRKEEGTVLDKTVALYEFLTSLKAQEKLEAWRMRLEAESRQALAKEYAQMYRIVMDLLNKLAQLLGQEAMGLREFGKMLEAGFAASSVGVIPPGYDQVLVGDIKRTRLGDVKVLFLAGANDGLIPRAEQQGGLLSQREREFFRNHDMELAPGARERAFIQKFYLYLNLTKPSRRLYVTWHRTSGEGKEARRSYLVGMIQTLFPGIEVVNQKEPELLLTIVTPKSSRRTLIEGIRRAREGQASPEFLALLSWYRGREDYSREAEAFLEAAFYTYEKRLLGRDAAHKLYGEVLVNSVTRLERFSACAYAHFMAYGMGLKERQMGEFAPVDMGSLFHHALECYSQKMEAQGYHWFDVPGDVQEQLMEEAVRDTVEEEGYLLYQDAAGAYTVKRLLRILKKTVEVISAQISQSSFAPEGYEVSFSFAEDLESVNFVLSEEERMRLTGRIDRMDTRKDKDQIYVKVVDYKSGSTQFSLVSLYHGLQLQLVVYLNAAVELLKQKYPNQEVVPAGMFYYHIDDPVIEAKGPMTEDEIKEQVFEKLKQNGIGLETGDASVSKKSQQASPQEMKLLSDFVNTKIRSLGKAIYRGEVTASPYQMKKDSGCDYCPYHGICGFDLKVPGFSYRRLAESKDKDEILKDMAKEVADGSEIHEGTAAGD